MTKTRLEAFSDGVLAVAITLLVLDLHAESGSGSSLLQQIRQEWPSFAAYLLSFFVVGVIWVNHHALLALAKAVDRRLLFYNLVLLFFVSTIPFTTSSLASFLEVDGWDNNRTAVVLYGLSMEGMSLGFTLMLRHLLKAGLTIRPVSAADGRKAVRRFGLGLYVYPVIVMIGLAAPIIMLILMAALTIFYIAEQTPILPLTTAEGATDQSPPEPSAGEAQP